MSLPTLSFLPLANLPTFATATNPRGPGNAIVPVPTPSTPSNFPPSPTGPVSPGQSSGLDWRWPAAMLLLWLALTAMYELGAPQLAVGFAVLIAAASLYTLGPPAMAEVVNLVSGGSN